MDSDSIFFRVSEKRLDSESISDIREIFQISEKYWILSQFLTPIFAYHTHWSRTMNNITKIRSNSLRSQQIYFIFKPRSRIILGQWNQPCTPWIKPFRHVKGLIFRLRSILPSLSTIAVSKYDRMVISFNRRDGRWI
jgi:hypothetical protein